MFFGESPPERHWAAPRTRGEPDRDAGGRSQGEGATAARAARPGQPATALALGSQVAEPQAAGSVSPCGSVVDATGSGRSGPFPAGLSGRRCGSTAAARFHSLQGRACESPTRIASRKPEKNAAQKCGSAPQPLHRPALAGNKGCGRLILQRNCRLGSVNSDGPERADSQVVSPAPNNARFRFVRPTET